MINERLPTVMSNLSGKLRINSAPVYYNHFFKRTAESLVAKTYFTDGLEVCFHVFPFIALGIQSSTIHSILQTRLSVLDKEI